MVKSFNTLFSSLKRGADLSDLKDLNTSSLSPQEIEDLFLIAFYARDIRGGVGERDLFNRIMRILLRSFPEAGVIELIPEYGRWDDVWKLYDISPEIGLEVDRVVRDQFILDQESEKPSLLAKWLPREGNYLSMHFAELLFPLTQSSARLKQYRKTLSYLNRQINTTEVKMCARSWESIEPSHVPKQLMRRNKSAFLNSIKVRVRGNIAYLPRFPGNLDRSICAAKFSNYMNKQQIQQIQQMHQPQQIQQLHQPHECVAAVLNTSSPSTDAINQEIWDKIHLDLSKIVFMCDFSVSMDGLPKHIAISLGILSGRFLTFDVEPTMYTVQQGTLRDKVMGIYSSDIGTGSSTNFQKALDLVLNDLVDGKSQSKQSKQSMQSMQSKYLVLITDMPFDTASSDYKVRSWEEDYKKILESFQRHGYEPPTIVCWNLRGEYRGAHAKAHASGVVELNGWSPSILQALCDGLTVETQEQEMRRILDAPRYDKVRAALALAFSSRLKRTV